MKVKVYKTNGCPWCEKVIRYLESKGIDIDICNCSESEDFRKELVEKTKQNSVPVIEINGQIVFGFDKHAIDTALKTKACSIDGGCE